MCMTLLLISSFYLKQCICKLLWNVTPGVRKKLFSILKIRKGGLVLVGKFVRGKACILYYLYNLWFIKINIVRELLFYYRFGENFIECF